jgi:hypothetical protein
VATVQQEQQLRVRKDVDELTADELAAFREAVALMQSRTDAFAYSEVAGIPGLPLPMHGIHGTPRFLLWNRAMLVQFEHALDGPLPFWDWVRHPRIPEAFEEPPLDSVAFPEEVREPAEAERTRRAPGQPGTGPLPAAAEIDELMGVADFEELSRRLEDLNGRVHIWVGGHMGLVPTSAYDPLYWVHRANVDRLWQVWAERHPGSVPPTPLLDEPLPPFDLTGAQVLDIGALGYRYAAADALTPPTSFIVGAANDRPGTGGALGFDHYAAAFAELIASPETSPPLTIGIFGSWGSGKSTLLGAIVDKLEEGQGTERPEQRASGPGAAEPPFVHVVSFNAWDYNANELIWPALARTVMEAIERDLPVGRFRRFWLVFRRNIKREWQRNSGRIVVGLAFLLIAAALAVATLDANPGAVLAAILGLGLGGVLKLVNDTVSSPASRWVGALFQKDNYGQRPSDLEAIRADLEWLEQRLQQTERDRRVLVLIDDLDRCEPDKAVEVLQAVNRLLDFDSFVVVLGVDARIVSGAIQSHYKNVLEEVGASGFEYLDKIVQIPFRIPDPDEEAIKTFLDAQLPTEKPPEDAEHRAQRARTLFVAASEQSVEEVDPRQAYSAGAPPAVKAPLGQRVPFTLTERQAFKDLARYLRPNPRHVKRLVNVYRLVRTLAERRRSGDPDAQIVAASPEATIRWLAISAQWPYTACAMLQASRKFEPGGAGPAAPVLATLHADARSWISEETRDRFDEDALRLEKLISESPLTWEELKAIRSYTINFNPAVEEQLRLEWAQAVDAGPEDPDAEEEMA